jgi:cell division GTPase FtsZ
MFDSILDYKGKLEKWLADFYKNAGKYIVTDNQALIKEYSGSVPRKDQIEDRVSTYVLKKFTDLVDTIVKTLNPKEKN